MIVRQFISWVRTAPAGERAEATRALARAWLISDLSEDDRIAAEGALLMLLDDASPLVRQAMADVFANAADAPANIVRALASDQVAVALPVLEFSPLLIDADLVDIVATGSSDVQCAIARRDVLPVSICAAIAEVGDAAAAIELLENPGADLTSFSIDRIVERHGHLSAVRDALFALGDLPAATRLVLASKVSDSLANFVTERDWIHPEQANRIASEAMERSIVNIAASAQGDDLANMVRHLRATSQLTAGLILRALLCGNTGLFNVALTELTGLPSQRVSSLLQERGGASVDALLTKANMPASTFPAFRAALHAAKEIGFVGSGDGAVRLQRRMVERVLTRCETEIGMHEPLLILLRRFATEAAREEARLLCDELAAEMDALPLIEEAPALAIGATYNEADFDEASEDLWDEGTFDETTYEDDEELPVVYHYESNFDDYDVLDESYAAHNDHDAPELVYVDDNMNIDVGERIAA